MAPLTQQPPQRTPTPQGGLLGQTPAQARADAFLAGLGGMGAGLLQAGATTTDPTQFGRGMASAAQGFTQGRQASLQQTMAQEAQKRAMALANAEAARKTQLHNFKIKQMQLAQNLLSPKQPQQRAVVSTSNLASGPEPLTMLSETQSQATATPTAQQSLISQIDPAIMSAIRAAPASEQMSMLAKAIETVRSSGTLDANQLISQEVKMRGDFQKELLPYNDTVEAFKRIEAIYIDPKFKLPQLYSIINKDTGAVTSINMDNITATGAQDLALIFNFMKALDPRSIVRESEFDMAASTSGVPTYIASYLQKIQSGEILKPEERKKLIDVARGQFIQADKSIAGVMNKYSALAGNYKKYGFAPERVIGGTQRYTPMMKYKPTPSATKNPLPKGTGKFVPVPIT